MFLHLRDISYSYPTARSGEAAGPVLRGVDLAVAEGEFFTLLGPSGCGKTTLLWLLAGFLESTGGDIALAGESLTGVVPERRGMGVVFQNYALFPHLSVFENVAFGLRAQRRPAAEIRTRVAEALAMVGLDGLDARRPAELSGGQQQRVAVARAIAPRPRLLLMDEPLSNLDAALRVETRTRLHALQRQLGITTIYVTHDQEEALAASDRIGLMQAGRLVQVDTPERVYDLPATRFVAGFLGRCNLLRARRDGDRLLVGDDAIPLPLARIAAALPEAADGPVALAFRPQFARLVGPGANDAKAAAGDLVFDVVYRDQEFLGEQRLAFFEAPRLAATPLQLIVAGDAARLPLALRPGASARLAIDLGHLRLVRDE